MRASRLFSAFSVMSLGCAPDLTVHASRITSARVIAVLADPPEARPGAMVSLTAIVAGASGDVAVTWRACEIPRSTNESATVSARCLDDGDGGAITTLAEGVTASATIPSNACMRVGPQVPPAGQDGVRARAPDPDITGGWQLPIRLDLRAGSERETMFARYRVRCQPPDVPGATAQGYALRYRDNRNPALSGVYAVVDGATRELPRASAEGDGAEVAIGPSREVGVLALWGAESAEGYVRVDPVTRGLDTRTEALEVAWFTTGGWFSRDRTAPDASGTASVNVLHLDAGVTQTRVWVVLRDERGGVDVARLRVRVGN
jgi:hypothetical protein